VATTSAFDLKASSSDAVEVASLYAPGSCDNPETQRLKGELQAAQQELARLRAELSHQPPVISDHDLDLEYFRPGNAGLNVGSPPLLNSEPLAPARVAQVELEERIASLQKALRIACERPEAARILIEIDDLEQQLNLLQRQFSLDQDAYYSKTDFAKYTAEKVQIDAEQRQIQILQAHIEQLKQELAAMNPSQR
jgi:multidrug efflux pump subunit AcrA (membrane-fusion protein)